MITKIENNQILINTINKDFPNFKFAGVFGSSQTAADYEEISIWGELARSLTKHNIGVINGGYQGTMKYISDLIKVNNGISIGITCSKIDDEISYECYSKIFEVNNILNRLEALIMIPDFYIVLPGGIGTLVEIISVLWFMDRNFISNKKIMLLGNCWSNVIPLITSNDLMFRSLDNIENLFIKVEYPSEIDDKINLVLRNINKKIV
ncbi:MAG TPA: hypothetical protein GXZ70_02075 [Clostridiales bacterium]|nr:hypothetical protein [Clostridiales bacterium]